MNNGTGKLLLIGLGCVIAYNAFGPVGVIIVGCALLLMT